MSDLGVLIPIIALSIPLVAVMGKSIVQPIVKALLTRERAYGPGPHDAALAARVEELERRLAAVERPVGMLVEEHEFRKALEAPPKNG